MNVLWFASAGVAAVAFGILLNWRFVARSLEPGYESATLSQLRDVEDTIHKEFVARRAVGRNCDIDSVLSAIEARHGATYLRSEVSPELSLMVNKDSTKWTHASECRGDLAIISPRIFRRSHGVYFIGINFDGGRTNVNSLPAW